MSDFNLVYSEFWPEARSKAWTDDMDKLGLYLLTCEHRTIAGLFRMPLPYVSADLGWPIERVANALGELIREGFIGYDHRAQAVLIRNSVKRQPPKSEKHIAGAIGGLSKLPKTPLLQELLKASETHAEGFAIAIGKAFEWVTQSPTAPAVEKKETHSNHARARADLRPHTTDLIQQTTKGSAEEGSTTTPDGPSAGLFKDVVNDLERRAS